MSGVSGSPYGSERDSLLSDLIDEEVGYATASAPRLGFIYWLVGVSAPHRISPRAEQLQSGARRLAGWGANVPNHRHRRANYVCPRRNGSRYRGYGAPRKACGSPRKLEPDLYLLAALPAIRRSRARGYWVTVTCRAMGPGGHRC